MAAGNYSVYRSKHISGVKFGATAWTSANMGSTATALDTSFATNNATVLLDAVAVSNDTNNPVKSSAFGKEMTESGNERSVSEENLLGADSNGTQHQELNVGPASRIEYEITLVYRNNVPASIFNDTTQCVLITMDNDEGTTTGQCNIAYNNIYVTHVGSKKFTPDGMIEQSIKFTCKGGTTGSAITVSQSTPVAETWNRIVGGDYAEEVRTA